MAINEWLALNRNVEVLESNICALPKVSVLGSEEKTGGEYAFYLFYTVNEEGAEDNVLAMYREFPTELTDPGIIESEVN